jgi:hypothetical protein
MRNIKLMPATLGEDTTAPRAFTVVLLGPAVDVSNVVRVLARDAKEAQHMAKIVLAGLLHMPTEDALLRGMMEVAAVFAGHHFDIMVAED